MEEKEVDVKKIKSASQLEKNAEIIVELQSKIFKIITAANNKEYNYKHQLSELNKKFDQKKSYYTDEIKKNPRYNLEYIFLLEQYTLNRMELESKIQRAMLYVQRLTVLSEHLRTRKSQRVLDVKRTFFSVIDAIQKELIINYNNKIEETKQRKKLSDSYNKYLDYLKDSDQKEYEEKLMFKTPDDELLEISEQIKKLKEEQKQIAVILSDKFQVSDDIILSMQLTNIDVLEVAKKIYPNLQKDDNEKKLAA